MNSNSTWIVVVAWSMGVYGHRVPTPLNRVCCYPFSSLTNTTTVTHGGSHDADLSEKVHSTYRANSGAADTTKVKEKSRLLRWWPLLHYFPPTPTRTPTSNMPCPLDSSWDNLKKRATGGRTNWKSVSFSEEQKTLTECLESRSHFFLWKKRHMPVSPRVLNLTNCERTMLSDLSTKESWTMIDRNGWKPSLFTDICCRTRWKRQRGTWLCTGGEPLGE